MTILTFSATGFVLAFLVFAIFGEEIARIVAGPVACLTVAFGLVVAIRIEKFLAGKGF